MNLYSHPLAVLLSTALFATSSLPLICPASAHAQGGVPLWTNLFRGAENSLATHAIAIDGSGNVFVSGSIFSRAPNGHDNYDYITIKCSNDGVLLWTNYYSLPGDYDDVSAGIALDNNGNLFVTGSSDDAFGSGTVSYYTTIKYSNAGVTLWTNRYDGPGNSVDRPNALVVDGEGNVFVTGRSTIDSIVNPAIVDYATVAYSNTGQSLWENRYNGPDNLISFATAIALDNSGNVFITGQSGNSDGHYDYVTIKYSSSVPAPHLDFQKLNNRLVLSWTNAGFNLQSAPAVTGPFTNLPAATSPYTNPLAAPQQFFRLASP
jgi:hypothetical protein